MSTAHTTTAAQLGRRHAIDDARAIVAFAGGVIGPEMEALNEGFVALRMLADEDREIGAPASSTRATLKALVYRSLLDLPDG